MRWAAPRRSGRAGQAGYALLLVIFVMTLMLISAMAASPSLFTQMQREKEKEAIWRGKQYARAVKLYYRKNGRFPSSLEDLSKPNLNVRYLRKAYADPLNSKDGSWRIIYVGPGGQLIGSRKRNLGPVQMPAIGGAQQQGSGAGQQQAKDGNQSKDSGGQSQNTSGTSEGQGQVFGGSIIGVGCKVNKPSIMVYDGASRYIDWEFIWDPSKDAIAVGQPGTTGTTGGSAPGIPASGGVQPGGSSGNPPTPPPLGNPPLE